MSVQVLLIKTIEEMLVSFYLISAMKISKSNKAIELLNLFSNVSTSQFLSNQRNHSLILSEAKADSVLLALLPMLLLM